MTELLRRAFDEAAQLSDAEQDRLAQFILTALETESEARWTEMFAQSQDVLAKLADEALAEFHAGTTLELDPDDL
ncbi:MAG: hypothetical protein IAE80_11220 [Anaerolinea sp.]|nr:hypothetical protein [Anaerolinea sp.]